MLQCAIHSIGKHKVPRYIYHLTNKRNYEAMVKSGVIRTSENEMIGRGVFAIELTNFFKRWRQNLSLQDTSLQRLLIKQASKRQGDIVILRIPTAGLDKDKLVVRSQNRLFSWLKSEKATDTAEEMTEKMIINRESTDHNWFEVARSLLVKLIKQKEGQDVAAHLTQGAPAKMSKSFKQRKEAIEYIYKDNIPISKAEKIGEVNVQELKKSAGFDPLRPIRSIFTNLLKGTPEEKGARLLNC